MSFPLSQIIRATCNWRDADGGLAQNVLHFARRTGTVVQADVDSIAGSVQNLWELNSSSHSILTHIDSGVELEDATARTIDPSNPLEAHYVIADPGLVSGTSVPLESAVVITWYTALASRRGRGRMFQPGLSIAGLDAGRLSAAALADFDTGAGSFITNMLADVTYAFVVWSPTSNVGNEITGHVTRTTLHHQKRRNS